MPTLRSQKRETQAYLIRLCQHSVVKERIGSKHKLQSKVQVIRYVLNDSDVDEILEHWSVVTLYDGAQRVTVEHGVEPEQRNAWQRILHATWMHSSCNNDNNDTVHCLNLPSINLCLASCTFWSLFWRNSDSSLCTSLWKDASTCFFLTRRILRALTLLLTAFASGSWFLDSLAWALRNFLIWIGSGLFSSTSDHSSSLLTTAGTAADGTWNEESNTI